MATKKEVESPEIIEEKSEFSPVQVELPEEPVKKETRGRKKGVKNGESKPALKAPKLDKKTFALQVQGVHAAAAQVLRSPELEINTAESEALATALIDISQHYNIAVNPKALAWFNLISVAAFIYVPKVGAIVERAKKPVKKQTPTYDHGGEYGTN